ncbi:MAG TPA: AI-2E family transporter [Chloroflexota bacterium]
MELLRGSRSEKLDRLITIAIVLGMLLIVLASAALLSSIGGILGKFRQQILLFVFGALIAYLLVPLVNLLQRLVKVRWAAVAGSYLLVLVALILFGVLLLNPFISQAQSLAANLRAPAAASLQSLQRVRNDLRSIHMTLKDQQQLVSSGRPVSLQIQQQTAGQIKAVQQELSNISVNALPRGQIRIPPSYVTPIKTPVDQMASAYETATASPGRVSGLR